MNYEEALDYIANLTKFGINPGLERIEELLRRLGNPHQQGMRFIHVTGTNGKGSTSVFTANILRAAGYKTALFSSPHIRSYQERMQINGVPITKEMVASLITEVAPILDQMIAEGFPSPTEFEVCTALALTYFAREQVDMVVMEVGLGGLHDSTNVIDSEIAVITNVAMDHMDYLGNTIAEIATEKAGIIKEHTKVVLGDLLPEALDICVATAREKQTAIYHLGEQLAFREKQSDLRGQIFDWQMGKTCYADVFIPLIGKHQFKNASLAMAVGFLLGVSEDAIRQGLAAAKWPCRLEIVWEPSEEEKRPMVIIDGAHNCHGMQALAQALKDLGIAKVHAVLGMLADKEREAALGYLLPFCKEAVITKAPVARAGNWQYLGDICKNHGVPYELEEDIFTACEKAVRETKPDEILLVAGSLYMAAVARAYFLPDDDLGE
ncbi:MAG: bifunctional folylpolyglutamate synthase/dihydrofolate synthase [Peptococcaceae bacterium]|nr:bifunctional folylpolyglutamate synthase/dihydrofolate synthase [Peptococcaceae bacterium]